MDHGLLCRWSSKKKPTHEEEHYKWYEGSPGLVAVGYGKTEKAVPHFSFPAQIRLSSSQSLPPDSYLPSKTLMARTSVNLGELTVDMRREGFALANPRKPPIQVLVTTQRVVGETNQIVGIGPTG